MRFFIFTNDEFKNSGIRIYKDEYADMILPTNLIQPVYYPIPIKLLSKIKKYLKGTEEEIQRALSLIDITNSESVDAVRIKYNSVIFDKCKEFRYENSEWFI
jgi:hypothetical protein